MYRVREINNKNLWDSLVFDYGEDIIYHLWDYGEIIRPATIDIKRISITFNSRPALVSQLLFLKPASGTNYIILPRGGPFILNRNYDSIKSLIDYVNNYCQRRQNVILKIEPRISYDADLVKFLTGLGFVKSKNIMLHIDNKTLIIDLDEEVDKLWANMNQSNRRQIRNSIKSGVSIKQASSLKDFEDFWDVINLTAERKRFYILDRNTYWQIYIKKDYLPVNFFLAYLGDKVIAAGMFSFNKKNVFYRWGGSVIIPGVSGLRVLLWEAIQEYQRRGFRRFDFLGFDESVDQKLSFFKQSFGGHEMKLIGAYDYIF